MSEIKTSIDPDRLYNKTEAREIAGVNQHILDKAMEHGLIEAVEPCPGARPRIPGASLIRWIHGGASVPPDAPSVYRVSKALEGYTGP